MQIFFILISGMKSTSVNLEEDFLFHSLFLLTCIDSLIRNDYEGGVDVKLGNITGTVLSLVLEFK